MPLKPLIHQYFFFSKKDRIAVVVLLLLIGLAWCLPYMFAPRVPPSVSADPGWVRVVDKMTTPVGYSPNRYQDDKPLQNFNKNSGDAYNNAGEGKLFTFDPNELDENGWRGLGVRDRTIETIIKYRNKGGQFRTPDDLRKVYGLSPSMIERLLPYVRILSVASPRTNTYDRPNMRMPTPGYHYQDKPPADYERSASGDQPGTTHYTKRTYSMVDLNKADTTALVALPCIGSKLALRIIQFRDKLGGFYSVEQVRETYGLTDSSFAVIRPYLSVNAADCRSISINEVSVDDLKTHPYVKYDLARTIIAYRTEHGNFAAVSDLKKISALMPEAFEKLRPYLKI